MQSLTQIAEQVKTCQKCDLYKQAKNPVPGEGNAQAKIMFIGEGPGATEDELGRPFVGNAGQLLSKLLALAGLKREDVYIANVVKHRPPNNRDPQPDEVAACWPYLEEQIKLIKPKIIIPLGRHAMARFIPIGTISRNQGRVFRREIKNLGKLYFYPIYHPAAALHQPSLYRDLENAFRRLPAVLKKVMAN
ncbi:MAG: uracil-DNA glycosylase [Patescibacteria group bacterium]|nr:uracil-DNA glycosylase [Patescibacteria group bacterium]